MLELALGTLPTSIFHAISLHLPFAIPFCMVSDIPMATETPG